MQDETLQQIANAVFTRGESDTLIRVLLDPSSVPKLNLAQPTPVLGTSEEIQTLLEDASWQVSPGEIDRLSQQPEVIALANQLRQEGDVGTRFLRELTPRDISTLEQSLKARLRQVAETLPADVAKQKPEDLNIAAVAGAIQQILRESQTPRTPEIQDKSPEPEKNKLEQRVASLEATVLAIQRQLAGREEQEPIKPPMATPLLNPRAESREPTSQTDEILDQPGQMEFDFVQDFQGYHPAERAHPAA